MSWSFNRRLFFTSIVTIIIIRLRANQTIVRQLLSKLYDIIWTSPLSRLIVNYQMVKIHRKVCFPFSRNENYSRTPPHWSHWDWRFFTFISGLPLMRGKITLNTITWDPKMLTSIDGEPLKAGLLLRGPTVLSLERGTPCHTYTGATYHASLQSFFLKNVTIFCYCFFLYKPKKGACPSFFFKSISYKYIPATDKSRG